MRPRIIVAFLIFASIASRGSADPRLAFEQGFLTARLGRNVVDGSELQTKLRSGLSTTFVIAVRGEASQPERRLETAAIVEVRYDLWDEVFVVTIRRAEGPLQRERVASQEALATFWNDRSIALAPAAGATRFTGELELRILPFSFSEERDAQGWVARSLGLSNRGSASPPTTTSGEPQPQRGVLDALIATSIRARPISVRRWRVATGAPER